MEQNIPAWLDEALLAAALQGGEGKEPRVKVAHFTAESALPPGSNYSSHIFRVRVVYKVGDSPLEHSASLIVKVPINEGVLKEVSEHLDFFSREPEMYRDRLTKMSKKVNQEFAPTYFYCPFKNGLILEDLKSEGYVMGDKKTQLDFQHCQFVFRSLAKFHAASVACCRDDTTFLDGIGDEIFYVEQGPMVEDSKLLITTFVKHFINSLDDIDVDKDFKDFLQSRSEKMWNAGVVASTPKTYGLNVLNHGDLWFSNLMFKYSCGDVIDVKFVDFQRTRFCSPAVDLTYFMWTSGDEEVRGSRQKELYNLYRHTLNSTLEQLGCPERLTEEELQADLESMTDFILLNISSAVPLMVAGPDDAITMGDISFQNLGSDKVTEKFKRVFNGKIFKAMIPTLVKQFENWRKSIGK
uniref:CHK kinase-like domain-containing protein n=1 Tax=Graphocephala atropunctata TaxID=36148 RepID=A0A1B6MDI4_9HEMI